MANSYADLTTLKSGGMLNITSAALDVRLLALLEDTSRWIDGYCNRHFFVLNAARRFDGGGGLELPVPDLIGVTTLKTDEDQDRIFELLCNDGDYRLYPLNAQPQQPWGRPYTRVLVDTAAGIRASFPSGQATVEIDGQWGYREVLEDSGADINQGGGFSATATVLTVTDGSKFAAGQTVLVESEQMYVSAVSGSDLTVERGVNGTTAAAHPDGSDISMYRYPGSVVEACLLLASRLWRRRGGDLASGPVERVLGLAPDPDVRRLLAPYRRVSVGVGV